MVNTVLRFLLVLKKGVVLWTHSQMQTASGKMQTASGNVSRIPHLFFSVHGALTLLASLAECSTSKELAPARLRIGDFSQHLGLRTAYSLLVHMHV